MLTETQRIFWAAWHAAVTSADAAMFAALDAAYAGVTPESPRQALERADAANAAAHAARDAMLDAASAVWEKWAKENETGVGE